MGAELPRDNVQLPKRGILADDMVARAEEGREDQVIREDGPRRDDDVVCRKDRLLGRMELGESFAELD